MTDRESYKTRWAREWRARNGINPRPARPFAFQPLMDAAMARVPETANPSYDIGQAYLLLGVTARLVSNWRVIGLSAYDADRCACALGLHPAEVYGYEWFAQLEEISA